jgi:hypothetical protein
MSWRVACPCSQASEVEKPTFTQVVQANPTRPPTARSPMVGFAEYMLP